VEDLAAPDEGGQPDDMLSPFEDPDENEEDASDPVVEYLRAMSEDFSTGPERTVMGVGDDLGDPDLPDPLGDPWEAEEEMPLSKLPLVVPVPSPMAPRLAPDPTVPEQAVVDTCFVRGQARRKLEVSSAVVPALKKRRTPIWVAALMGATIAGLLLTSSLFTVEVLASKQKAGKTMQPSEEAPELAPAPKAIPR
jgi:hypothetical protein